ncbi:hypothetical protein [Streptomyces sp. JV190]|uniref:hypothetical protein n=2 Tax=Streptomyces TaxID=1883 RepID=UPI002E7A4EB3|nr:hypothetical protein [Streptomyces sp. JV190]MEE1841621.1 hypothetical protein [Streptomyces sp. JV190]
MPLTLVEPRAAVTAVLPTVPLGRSGRALEQGESAQVAALSFQSKHSAQSTIAPVATLAPVPVRGLPRTNQVPAVASVIVARYQPSVVSGAMRKRQCCPRQAQAGRDGEDHHHDGGACSARVPLLVRTDE